MKTLRAETKHLVFDGDSVKALNALPGYDASVSAGVTSVGDAYAAASYGYRCIHLRANSISQIPYQVTGSGSGQAALRKLGWDYEHVLPRLLWLTEAALCLYGAAYWFRERNLVRTMGYRWLAPQTISPVYDREQGITGYKRRLDVGRRQAFGESLNREDTLDRGVPVIGAVPDFTLDDVVAFYFPDPETELGPGRSPTHVALEAIGLLKYVNEYASGFFKRGAIPAVLLSVKGPATETDLKKLEAWWKRLAQGVRQAWATVAVRADVTPVIIGQPVSALAMPDLSVSARGQIAVAYGVPETLLEDAANYATAKTHRKSFYVETVIPEALLIQGLLNEQVFSPAGLRFDFMPEQMQIMQEEEAERSLALGQLVSAGIPLLVAMNILGFYVDASVLDDLELAVHASDPAQLEKSKLMIQQARVRLADERQHIAQDREARLAVPGGATVPAQAGSHKRTGETGGLPRLPRLWERHAAALRVAVKDTEPSEPVFDGDWPDDKFNWDVGDDGGPSEDQLDPMVKVWQSELGDQSSCEFCRMMADRIFVTNPNDTAPMIVPYTQCAGVHYGYSCQCTLNEIDLKESEVASQYPDAINARYWSYTYHHPNWNPYAPGGKPLLGLKPLVEHWNFDALNGEWHKWIKVGNTWYRDDFTGNIFTSPGPLIAPTIYNQDPRSAFDFSHAVFTQLPDGGWIRTSDLTVWIQLADGTWVRKP